MITVNWLNSANDIPESLWQQCFPSPFEGRWWYLVLEKSGLEDQFSFTYGLLLRNEQPIGILPAFVMNVPMAILAPEALVPFLPFLSKISKVFAYQRTLFVGSPCADEGTVGLIPGTDLTDIVEPLQTELLKQAQKLQAVMLVWKDFPQSAQPALDQLCQNKTAFKVISYPGTVVQFPEASMKSYYGGLKSSRRHNLLKKIKRGYEKLPVKVAVIQNPDQPTLDEIFSLFWQTYENGKTKFERLNKDFFSLIAAQKESWFVLLREPEENKLVAMMLCFVIGDRLINKFIGLDYGIDRQANLYFQLWHAAVEWSISQGIKEIQSGQTGYRFKTEVGHSLVPLNNYCLHKNPLINWFYASVGRTISWTSLDPELATYLKAYPDLDPSAAK